MFLTAVKADGSMDGKGERFYGNSKRQEWKKSIVRVSMNNLINNFLNEIESMDVLLNSTLEISFNKRENCKQKMHFLKFEFFIFF